MEPFINFLAGLEQVPGADASATPLRLGDGKHYVSLDLVRKKFTVLGGGKLSLSGAREQQQLRRHQPR